MLKRQRKMYPYGEPVSRLDFPNRIETELVEGKVVASINMTNYPQYKTSATDAEMKNFLLDRIHDYSNALARSEQQIVDMQRPEPFIPQDYGFELSMINNQSYYSNGYYNITRGTDDVWVFHILRNDTFVNFDLPDKATAETVLLALGAIKVDEVKSDEVHTLQDKTLTDSEKDRVVNKCNGELKEIEAMLNGPNMLSESTRSKLLDRMRVVKEDLEQTLKTK